MAPIALIELSRYSLVLHPTSYLSLTAACILSALHCKITTCFFYELMINKVCLVTPTCLNLDRTCLENPSGCTSAPFVFFNFHFCIISSCFRCSMPQFNNNFRTFHFMSLSHFDYYYLHVSHAKIK